MYHFSENMIAVIRCLVEACRELDIPYNFMDDNRNVVRIDTGRPFYFVNFASPFGRHDIVRICKDKEFTYRLLKDAVAMPRTRGYLDPYCREAFRKYARCSSVEEIAADIQKEFVLPVVIKPNQGTRGRNVFLCRDETNVRKSVNRIFNKKSRFYDFVAVVQDFIQPEMEYRVILLEEEILMAYAKDIRSARFRGNISPLHWDGAKAVPVTDRSLISRFEKFLQPVHRILTLEFSGVDIIRDQKDRLWLLEINSQPDFELFIRDNGPAEIVEVYKRVLLNLKKRG